MAYYIHLFNCLDKNEMFLSKLNFGSRILWCRNHHNRTFSYFTLYCLFSRYFLPHKLTWHYFKDILGPISHVKILGTGGLNEENLGDYLKLGMVGAGISGRLVDKAVREAGDYATLSARAAAFVAIANQ